MMENIPRPLDTEQKRTSRLVREIGTSALAESAQTRALLGIAIDDTL